MTLSPPNLWTARQLPVQIQLCTAVDRRLAGEPGRTELSHVCYQGGGVASGGLRELIPTVARTAVAVGVDGIFMEVS